MKCCWEEKALTWISVLFRTYKLTSAYLLQFTVLCFGTRPAIVRRSWEFTPHFSHIPALVVIVGQSCHRSHKQAAEPVTTWQDLLFVREVMKKHSTDREVFPALSSTVAVTSSPSLVLETKTWHHTQGHHDNHDLIWVPFITINTERQWDIKERKTERRAVPFSTKCLPSILS